MIACLEGVAPTTAPAPFPIITAGTGLTLFTPHVLPSIPAQAAMIAWLENVVPRSNCSSAPNSSSGTELTY